MENTVAINTSRQQLSGRDNDSDDALIPDSAGNSLESLRSTRWRNVVTVGILCFINLINYMDRFTLAGILTDVQDHFHKRDDEVGLLQTVFIISYMLFAPVFGYLGDRRSRKILMASGIFLWSLTTLIGSYVDNFWWFMFFRAMVGIGEASYSTIAPTIISDLFVKDVRSKMLALFYFAIPVGSGLGYIVGSETAKLLGGWQWGLRVTPALGAVAVLLMLLVMQDPARGEAEGGSHVAHSSYKEDIKALLKNRSFMFSTAGFTCVAFVAGALAWWGPHFIFLGLKLQPDQTSVTFNDVSFRFGLVSMASGIIGVPLGSLIARKLRPSIEDCDPLICAFALISSSPLVYLAIVMAASHTKLTYAFIFFGSGLLNLTWSIVADMLLVSSRVSLIFGVISMVSGLIGVPLGVSISEALYKRCPRVQPIVCAVGMFLSAPLLLLAIWLIESYTIVPFALVFFGQLALNLNWALVADMLLYVVIPTRRSTAEAFQILISHTFGDAGSPYLIGVISELLKVSLAGFGIVRHYSNSVSTTVLQPHESDRVKFKSLQYALFITTIMEVLGGIFFIITARFIVRDKMRVERVIAESSGIPTTHQYADDILGNVNSIT